MTAATLRLLADETRLRVLHVLAKEPLTVAELQDILDLGQSSISGHLAKLKHAGLIHDVAEGASRRYRLRADAPPGMAAAWQAVAALSAADARHERDLARLGQQRHRRGQAWIDRVAGSLHREYAPGRTWASLCQGLLHFADFGHCVDVGAGDGAMIELLAPRSRSLICVDPSPAMIAAGEARLVALRARGLARSDVRFHTSSGEAPNLPRGSANSVLFLQSLQYMDDPATAVAAAVRILAPGGRLLIMTLLHHDHDEAERFGHRHRGFTADEITAWCHGLLDVRSDTLPPETRAPNFQTLIITARKDSR